MSAVVQVLDQSRSRALEEVVPAVQVRRWGAPLWASDQPPARVKPSAEDKLSPELYVLAFMWARRG